jgi:hypothetical protein
MEKQRRLVPEKGSSTPDEDREFQGELTSFILEQGDMVYIPRGTIHAAECGSESSLHVTLGIHPDTLDEFLAAAVKAATLRDDGLRMALPVGFLRKGREEIAAKALDALRGMLDRRFLEQVVDQYRNETVKKFPLDVSGQIASHFQSTPLQLEDQIAPRAGAVYTVSPGEESVSLYVGSRMVTFPDFFGEALDFALKTPLYAIRALPGELEDDERLAFIERLLLEGLVVRR